MKKVSLLLGIGLLCVSLSSLAGEVITNDTGEDVTGLRVVFSKAVQITAFGDTLMQVDQTGAATEFVFSGETVSPWGSHWLNWSPATARVVEYDWLTDSALPLQGLAAEQRADRPIVTGNLLNPDYFAHPAYVMQGVSERNAVFALPLDGIEELAFYPIVDGVDLEDVTWSVEVSHPEGIGASIEGRTLYIWGSNASWAGYGEVTLAAGLGEAVSSVMIPVTVFDSSRTLINVEGKKDYFVPWSPELDVNRILSVEEHMRVYNKDEGNLDRSIQWSRWKKMPFLFDVEKTTRWANELVWNGGWSQTSQFRLVDMIVDEWKRMGVNCARMLNPYYIQGLQDVTLSPVYDRWNSGPTMRPEEVEYFVNECHRNGIMAMPVINPGVDMSAAGGFYEIWQADPASPSKFWDSYVDVMRERLPAWQRLGVDFVAAGNGLEFFGPNTYENSLYNRQRTNEVIKLCRQLYSGPITLLGDAPWHDVGGIDSTKAEHWELVDILSISVTTHMEPLTPYADPTYEQLVDGWKRWIAAYYAPFQKRYNKPFFTTENGCWALAGAANWGAFFFAKEEYPTAAFDASEQVDFYRSFLDAFSDVDGFSDLCGLWYSIYPSYELGSLYHPVHPSPRLRPLAEFLQERFTGSIPGTPVTLDGSLDEWSDEALVYTVWQGNASSADIRKLYFTNDDKYLYFALDLRNDWTQPVTIYLDTDADGISDYFIPIERRSYFPGYPRSDNHYWDASVRQEGATPMMSLGVVDVVKAEEGMEIRIWRPLLENEEPLRCKVITYSNTGWRTSQDTHWVMLFGEDS